MILFPPEYKIPNPYPKYFQKPVVLVGNGTVSYCALEFLIKQGFFVVAADGGANQLRKRDIVPHLIVGDMDSLCDISYWENKSLLLHLHEQYTTDLEKCFYATKAPAYYCLGFTGKRFDHTLATIHVVTKYALSRKIFLVDETDLIIVTNNKFSMETNIGERVSIYPLQSVKISASYGLKYPLNNLVFQQGKLIGTSNQAERGYFEIIPEKCHNDRIYAVIIPSYWLRRIVFRVAK